MAEAGLHRDKVKPGVVIVNYFTYWLTIDFVRNQLLKQDINYFGIVIVDNSSPNESLGKLISEFEDIPMIKILSNDKNSGFAAGNNIGIKHLKDSGCEFILISNTDIEIADKQLLERCIWQCIQIDGVAFVSPLVYTEGRLDNRYTAWKLPGKMKEILSSTYFLKIIGKYYLKKHYYVIDNGMIEPVKVDCLPGSFFLGPTESFTRIGYFDENTFLYYEETILGARVKAAGMQNFVLPSLKCIHNHAKTVDLVFTEIDKHRMLLKSRIYYWTKYKEAGKFFVSALIFLFFVLKIELIVSHPLRRLFKNSKHLKE